MLVGWVQLSYWGVIMLVHWGPVGSRLGCRVAVCPALDVGDGLSPTSTILKQSRRAPTSERCHKYRNSVTNIQKLLPT